MFLAEGLCEDVGMESISSKDGCGDAAESLGLSDTTPASFTNTQIAPHGCVWKRKQKDGTYRLKWNPEEVHYEASATYVLICAKPSSEKAAKTKKVAPTLATTPAPTLAPTPATTSTSPGMRRLNTSGDVVV